MESGLRDIMIAEKEIVLTFLLQLLSETGILARLAFKGGTCLRKMFVGGQGRFSTDLDFTGIEEHDHEDIILQMMESFEQPFHGIQFAIPGEGYYETQDGLSWGVNPTYSHEWNEAGSEIKLQISRRETPTLPTELRQQWLQMTLYALSHGRNPAALAFILKAIGSSSVGRCHTTREVKNEHARDSSHLETTSYKASSLRSRLLAQSLIRGNPAEPRTAGTAWNVPARILERIQSTNRTHSRPGECPLGIFVSGYASQ